MSEAAAIAQLLADPDPGIATALRRQLIGREEDPPGLCDAVEALPDAGDRARARAQLERVVRDHPDQAAAAGPYLRALDRP